MSASGGLLAKLNAVEDRLKGEGRLRAKGKVEEASFAVASVVVDLRSPVKRNPGLPVATKRKMSSEPVKGNGYVEDLTSSPNKGLSEKAKLQKTAEQDRPVRPCPADRGSGKTGSASATPASRKDQSKASSVPSVSVYRKDSKDEGQKQKNSATGSGGVSSGPVAFRAAVVTPAKAGSAPHLAVTFAEPLAQQTPPPPVVPDYLKFCDCEGGRVHPSVLRQVKKDGPKKGTHFVCCRIFQNKPGNCGFIHFFW